MKEVICEEIRNKKIIKELKQLVPDDYLVDSNRYYHYDTFDGSYHTVFNIFKTEKVEVVKRELKIVGYKFHFFREDEPIERWVTNGTKMEEKRIKKARINFTKKEMEIYDRNIYENLKKFGIKYKFNKLIKCWDGCEDE